MLTSQQDSLPSKKSLISSFFTCTCCGSTRGCDVIAALLIQFSFFSNVLLRIQSKVHSQHQFNGHGVVNHCQATYLPQSTPAPRPAPAPSTSTTLLPFMQGLSQQNIDRLRQLGMEHLIPRVAGEMNFGQFPTNNTQQSMTSSNNVQQPFLNLLMPSVEGEGLLAGGV